ncbi:MAG TPA: hypothetical protein PK728_12020 [Bacillota bacterium]|nr:hypothetical protein [Bacillota bacterium]
MAIDWDQFRKEIQGKLDWIGAAQGDYGEHLYRARGRFIRAEVTTVRDVKALYRRVATQLRAEIEGITPGTLRRAHLTALAGVLEKAARTLNQEVLDAVTNGIRLAVDKAVSGPEEVARELFSGVFDQTEVKWLFADINQRAVLSLLSRTRHDGLKLSDRVWRISQHARQALQKIVEDGVTRGLDSRQLARQVQRYLQPDVWTALKAETRRNLGVPKSVSMEAMRLAVTEMNNAFHEGTINAYQAVPSARGIYWRLSHSHPIRDVCDDYAAHNGNGFWPKGEEPARPHPFCKCVIIPAMEDPDEFKERLKAWMLDPASQPDLEMWYNSTARRFLRRPAGLTGTGGSESSPVPNLLKGYTLYGGKTRDVAIRQLGNTKIVVPVDLDTTLQKLTVDEVGTELEKLPERLKSLVNEIQILDYRNPDDLYWEQKYGIKDFRSFATGGKGRIHFYANEYMSPEQIRRHLPETLAHEAGHNLDQDLGQKISHGNYFSDTQAWQRAVNDDYTFSRKKWVSPYAEKTQSVHEDFADSVCRVLLDRTYFEHFFRNRAALIKRELGL